MYIRMMQTLNTTQSNQRHDRSDLVRLANTAMVEHGLAPEFPESVLEELSTITVSAKKAE